MQYGRSPSAITCIEYWRAAIAGFLTVPLGGLLWPLLGTLAHMVEARRMIGIDVTDALMMPVYLALFFGWGIVPLGVIAALAAAAWGNAGLRRFQRPPDHLPAAS
jgi:hypothetical protein